MLCAVQDEFYGDCLNKASFNNLLKPVNMKGGLKENYCSYLFF